MLSSSNPPIDSSRISISSRKRKLVVKDDISTIQTLYRIYIKNGMEDTENNKYLKYQHQSLTRGQIFANSLSLSFDKSLFHVVNSRAISYLS